MVIILQIKLVCMLIILHFTKLHLIKCNVSRVVSIKQNVNCEVFHVLMAVSMDMLTVWDVA